MRSKGSGDCSSLRPRDAVVALSAATTRSPPISPFPLSFIYIVRHPPHDARSLPLCIESDCLLHIKVPTGGCAHGCAHYPSFFAFMHFASR